MKATKSGARRRVAIWLDLDWVLKRELEVDAGFQSYADHAGWECTIDPGIERTLIVGGEEIPYDELDHQIG